MVALSGLWGGIEAATIAFIAGFLTQAGLLQEKLWAGDWTVIASWLEFSVVSGVIFKLLSRSSAARPANTTPPHPQWAEIEQKLHQSETRFRQLLDTNLIGIGFADLEGTFVEANEAFLSIIDYQPEDLKASRIKWQDLTPPGYEELDHLAIEQLKSTGICKAYEKAYLGRDGQLIPVLISAATLQTEPQQVVCFVVDLRDRYLAQQKIQHAHERFQQAATALNCIIYDWDIQTHQVEHCHGMMELLGYSPLEVEPTNDWWRSIIHPEDLQRTISEMEVVLENIHLDRYQIEYRVQNTSGDYLYVCDRGIITRNSEGIPLRVVGCTVDLSEQISIQQELFRHQQEFRALVENSPDIISRFDQAFRHIYMNPAIEPATGLSPQHFLNKNYRELGIAPEKYHPWIQTLQQVFNTGQEQVLEFDFPDGQGNDRYYQSRLVPEFSTQGIIESILGVTRDITNLKQVESALRNSEARFTTLAENIPGVIYQYCQKESGEDAFLYLSSGCLDLFEVPPEAALENANLLWQTIHPEDTENFRSSIQESAIKRERWRHEWRIITPSGQVKWVQGISQPSYQSNAIIWDGFLLDITERKFSEAALRDSEAKFRSIFNNVSVGIFLIGIDGYILSANEAQCRFLGYAMQDLVGMHFSEFTHPEDCHLDQASYRQLLRQEIKSYAINKRHIKSDGSLVWGRLTVSLIHHQTGTVHYTAVVCEDITEQKRATAEQQKLAEIVENCSDFISISTPQGQGIYLNAAGRKMLGLPNDLPIQQIQMMDYLMPENLDEFYHQILPDVWSKGRWEGEFQFRHFQTGKTIPVLHNLFAIRNPQTGECTALATVSRDNTLAKQVAQERELLLQREQEARKQAEAASRMKDEFLAIVSHELRSPLNAMLGWARLLRSRKFDSSRTQQALEVIERNAQIQTQLIEDLLDISRIIRGQLRLYPRPVNLSTVITAALDTMRPAAEAKRIQLDCQCETVGTIDCDPDRMQQVVWNLVSNGVKFTPSGGRVQVRLFQSNQVMTLQVSDTGKGISAEFLPHVFERFRQADSKSTRAYGGLGLGLAIVRNLVELHGGTIQVESAGENQGCTFTVELPYTPSPERVPETVNAAPLATTNSLEGVRVLLVDDEADTREFLMAALEQYGAETIACSCAAEVLQRLPVLKPQVLISDIGMPLEDGYSLIRKLRALPPDQGGQTPAAALTAYAREEDRVLALEAGFQVHVPKPIEPMQLISVVLDLVASQQ